MKTTITVLVVIAVELTGCDKSEIGFNEELTDGFCLVSNDKVILNHSGIEYYDYSTHLIYMKENGPYKATFDYPGLSYQVEKKDIQQAYGQIWHGSLKMKKDLLIE